MNNYLFITLLLLFTIIKLCNSQSSDIGSSGSIGSNDSSFTNKTCTVYNEVTELRVCEISSDLQIQGARNCSKIDLILNSIKEGSNFTTTTQKNCFYALSKLLCSINCVKCNTTDTIQPKVCLAKLCIDFVSRCFGTGIAISIIDCVSEQTLIDDADCSEIEVLLELDASFRRESSFSTSLNNTISKTHQTISIILLLLFLFI